MASVAQVLKSKTNRSFHTVPSSATVFDAIVVMSREGIGALVVTCGCHVCGMVTERDYARKVILQDRSSRNTTIHEIMSTPVRFVRPSQTSDECMRLMTDHRIRHLPVIEDGVLIGLVSIGDLVKNLIAEQQFAIDQLAAYVHGTSLDAVSMAITHRPAFRQILDMSHP
ncbi:CBS domain-containing protein [Pararobbsia alpina]|uniref:Inosine-5'-monophosphate dehydrogenase n=1 Tax=Pararobbsia alpina TaxID=621374 RepID=A0A6S7BNV2_9BURK|nr:CBS domain-containing protein [Pararobbsia alpina]CAB3791188.1 Inosine-5'-monophosphate dehydrogenase [Pararobbsia alpina]